MNKTSFVSAKTFLKMAEYDRKLLTVTGVINTILLISMTIKLVAGLVCTVASGKK